ncbi:hypothetical protein [Bacillus subtilis]|uniref:hypothetical protein n=1 Tax=Bacillus subtilis TaxID=1423 RepID=UPI004045B474
MKIKQKITDIIAFTAIFFPEHFKLIGDNLINSWPALVIGILIGTWITTPKKEDDLC